MLRSVRFCFLVLLGFMASCTLAVDTDALNEGCGEGTKLCDGVCVSILDTETGCGSPSCVPCALQHADVLCAPSGACVIATCTDPYEDCDGNPANGCEVNLDSDPKFCGSCNADPCDLPNVERQACSRGSCAIGKCAPDFLDCNERASDGCEVNKLTDRENCGKCGNACGPGQSCVKGSCQ
jgi:hypothetical protein